MWTVQHIGFSRSPNWNVSVAGCQHSAKCAAFWKFTTFLFFFSFFSVRLNLGTTLRDLWNHRFGYTRAPDPYFEIWVWKASILVRVLVSSSNTFSWRRTEQSQGGNSRWRDSLQPVGLLPPPTCTATPKLFPSSIFGTCSCSHMDTCNINTHLKLI